MNIIRNNMSRRLSACMLAVTALLGSTTFAAEQDDADQPYNVLMIIIDDAAPSMHSVGQSGAVRTPNIERIASQGTWFNHAYCAAPACNPSRMSLLTGALPSRSGVYYNSQKFPENWIADAETIPARFKRAGYLTAGYGKIAHDMRAAMPDFTEGYVKRHNIPTHVTHPDKTLRQHIIPGSLREARSRNFTWGILPDDWDRDDPEKWQQDTQQANRAIEFLGRDHDQPFFLTCGFWRPHVTFEVPQRYYDMHPLDEIEVPAGYHPFDLEDLPKPGRWLAKPTTNHPDMVSRGLWKKSIQGYLASMSYIDEQIGRVLDALEASGQADRTIVVFFSDNGVHLGEKEHWLKYTLWEQATGVFMSIHVPGYPNQTSDSPVGLIDLYPTLMTLANLDPPEHELDGVNLTPLLAGETDRRGRPVLSTWGRGSHSLRSERYRYIQYRNGDEELYDHTADPHEWHNLASDPELDSVKRRLAAHIPETDAPDTVRANPDSTEWDDEAFE